MSSRLVALLIIVAGCGHPGPPPIAKAPPAPPDAAVIDAEPTGSNGSLDRDLPRLAQRALALYKDVAAAFAATGEDCAAATTKLGELAATYGDVVAANAKVLHEHRAKELRAALVPYQDELDAAAQAIMGSKTLTKCALDKGFENAFDRLVGSPP